MENTNIKLMLKLQSWDPLGYGIGFYETENIDVLQAVHELNDRSVLAKRIQSIYENSFEELIPLSECEIMAQELSQIANTEICDL
ncbi:DUF1871 family protein [Cytobacillus sp. Hm23]